MNTKEFFALIALTILAYFIPSGASHLILLTKNASGYLRISKFIRFICTQKTATEASQVLHSRQNPMKEKNDLSLAP